MECFAWPAGVFVVKHFRPNPMQLLSANITGFFYTVWTCFKGEDDVDVEASNEIGFLEKIDVAVEEKLSKFKRSIKAKFQSRKDKYKNWKAKKTMMAQQKKLEY